MKSRLIRQIAAAAAVTVAATGFSAGAASAFEPPADPNDNFTCDGGPVAGHPGHRGLAVAMGHASSPTAWNAAFNAGPITSC